MSPGYRWIAPRSDALKAAPPEQRSGVETFDAIVIGGGIVGCSTAIFLAREGLSVALLERSHVASQQSGLNAGWIRSLGRTRAELPLSGVAMQLWQEWAAELDLPLTVGGGYSVAGDQAELARLLHWKRLVDSLLTDTEVLSGSETAAVLPFLQGSWAGALYRQGDAHCEPGPAMRSIAGKARAMGVDLRERTQVQRIVVAGGAVRGLACAEAELSAPRVICAAGAWSSRLLRTAGVRLPVQILRSTALRTQPVAPITDACIVTPFGALRQSRDGALVIAGGVRADIDVTLESLRYLRWFLGSSDHARGRVAIHPGFLPRELLVLRKLRAWRVAGPWPERATPNHERAQAALAAFTDALGIQLAVAKGGPWAGYVDVTPDATPVIGPAPAVAGLYVASGFSGHGFGIGPAAGMLCAQLVLDEPPVADPAPFRLERMQRPGALRTPEEMLI
jgi:glycine/D-amino acid oxidase-like deaminating enzyme